MDEADPAVYENPEQVKVRTYWLIICVLHSSAQFSSFPDTCVLLWSNLLRVACGT